MNYTLVNFNEWRRSSLFQFYIDKMRIVMSLTVDVDVTNLKAYSKAHHLDFYPLMVWVVSKIINAHDEFKYSWDADGHLIKWDFEMCIRDRGLCHPSGRQYLPARHRCDHRTGR